MTEQEREAIYRAAIEQLKAAPKSEAVSEPQAAASRSTPDPIAIRRERFYAELEIE